MRARDALLRCRCASPARPRTSRPGAARSGAGRSRARSSPWRRSCRRRPSRDRSAAAAARRRSGAASAPARAARAGPRAAASSSAASSPRTSTAGWRGLPLSKRAQERAARRDRASGESACQASADRRQERHARLGVEHGHGEPALAHVDAELDRSAVVLAGRREPGADAGRAGARVGGGERSDFARHLHDGASGHAPAAGAPPSDRVAVTSCRRPACAVCGTGCGGSRRGCAAARLVAHRDEQRGDVFAVLPGFGERGAGAIRFDALGGEIDPDRVRVGVRPLDPPLGARFGHLHVLDDAPTRVVETAQKRPRSEQASESAVA